MEFAFTSETARSLCADLSERFPSFPVYLATDSAFSEGEGRHTYAGIWADFSHWARANSMGLPKEAIEWLGSYASACYGSKDSDVSTAVATCFLENVAGEAVGVKLVPYLSPEARAYISKWYAAS